MLLLHQVGSVKIGEVVRYTVAYTPSQDRILPSPEKLYVRVRNTSTIALRAAFVHGPYTLSVSAYPSTFDPNEKFTNTRRYGVPAFEPMLKAGGSWECELVVPDDIRQAAGTGRHGGFGKSREHDAECASWIIEVTSQVIFSTSAAVGYEVVVARDPKSLNLTQSLPVVGNQSHVPQPGRVSDHQQSVGAKDGHHPAQPKGIFSRAIHVKVEDTATLWNTPRLPGWDDAGGERAEHSSGADKPVESVVKTGDPETSNDKKIRKRKKVHLVILTHGLHSNLGADMLYMKESIDAAAKQAKVDAKARRAAERRQASTEQEASRPDLPGQGRKSPDDAPNETKKAAANSTTTENHDFTSAQDSNTNAERPAEDEKLSYDKSSHNGQEAKVEDHSDQDESEDDEEVIVRGYSGNATKTERGIKYLGKRLARYVLSMTYPDQPFFPIGKGALEGFTNGVKDDLHIHPRVLQDAKQAHKHSTIQADADQANREKHHRPYRITSISFVGHSLGGLVQTYAVAYIQKHSPQFFDLIKPINFIALASPFLGLSNENPVYVRFALDFGLVGRTGQDLGLTWRAPTIARSGWGALVSNLGESAHKKVYGETRPESKPLLRILPTGPAHTALKKFRSRTVYSNVVNDGIVPLRTSCLLFLDWQGLGRVEKARRDVGLVETVVGFGWAELTGANMASPRHKNFPTDDYTDSGATTPRETMREVPQPSTVALEEDDRASVRSMPTTYKEDVSPSTISPMGPFAGFFNLFRSNEPPKEQPLSQKQKKILRRGQTMPLDQAPASADSSSSSDKSDRPLRVTTGNELEESSQSVLAPPKTTFFESAGDLLNPSLPTIDYLVDPTRRPRTIFHDRVYHPSDIPPPPPKKRSSLMRLKGSQRSSMSGHQSTSNPSSPTVPPNRDESNNVANEQAKSTNTSPERVPTEVVDESNMRVEEKIARAYHRDLSWRKVLVKLEPDAHNNIIVRRKFANAFGWPVVKHLVDAHFSDSAIARMRNDDEHVGERALDMNQAPKEDGGETKPISPPKDQIKTRVAGPRKRNDSEAREARDQVPDLRKPHDSDVPWSPHSGRFGLPERADSVTWSERDWVDSDNESDTEADASGSKDAKQRQAASEGRKDKETPQAQSSPSSWSWTEKIVGKGTRGRSKSPKGGEVKKE
ncbi:hypothetical protein HIM_00527 [Hirsutella minnesotensis 3608]|nr:hypothetical protein HIM_00527 [Hirsutella minnesotensis 3608]